MLYVNVSLGQVVTYGLNVSCTIFFVSLSFFMSQNNGWILLNRPYTFYIFTEIDFQEKNYPKEYSLEEIALSYCIFVHTLS